MNVVLIGYRGSGKTTVGRLVAVTLGLPFFDTDEIIARDAGRSIADIFGAEGEGGFRRRESEVIARVASEKAAVISPGGGAVEDASNMKRLKEGGRIAWLQCPPETLHGRITSDASSPGMRPSLTARGGLAEVREVLRRREPLFRSWANATFDTARDSPQRVAADIVAWVEASAFGAGC